MAKFSGINKALSRLEKMNKLMTRNVGKATRRNAIDLRDNIKRTIRDGRADWEPVSGVTSGRKGSTKPLIDKGDLLNSVDRINIDQFKFFIGVPRGVTNDNGIEMINIAAVHEFGAEINPKKAEKLAIPVSKEASKLSQDHGGVGNIPDLFRPKGTSVLAKKTAGGFEIMFILLDQVIIPPRSFIGSTYHDRERFLRRRWRNAVEASLRGDTYRG